MKEDEERMCWGVKIKERKKRNQGAEERVTVDMEDVREANESCL